MPDGVVEIGYRSFEECKSLTEIIIPETVTVISLYAFNDCTSLTSINIPDSVTSIGFDAFYDCISLTSITIPGSVTKIEDYAFYGCNNLKTFNIPSYKIFTMLDYDSKIVALNTIIRDKKQGEYSKEDICKFKKCIIKNKNVIFESILKNSNLMDLLYYMLDNSIYTKDELLDLIDKYKDKTEITGILLEYSNKNREEKDIESIIEDEFNLDDDEKDNPKTLIKE